MRVFDLRCAHDHRFEGWFASGEAFESQLARGLVSCPMCGESTVTRLPSAPHLNLSASRESRADRAPATRSASTETQANPAATGAEGAPSGTRYRPRDLTPEAALAEKIQGEWLKRVRQVIRETENVGNAFAEEARKMHYQEAPERAIRGVASADQVAELAEEGIQVVTLPIPDAAKEPLQ